FAGFETLGSKKSLMASWITHWLGIKGPSYIIDTACSSSLYAMERAYRILRSGEADDMIVAGSQLCLNPLVNMQLMRLGVLSPDGYSRPFDIDANGYMRSESMTVVYLQKAKNAKRIYATLIH
ncbi:PREDICTED: fatty acid synthase-like, partial [Dinoponera quadriceps]|uniref:Fatty acid synthase-like n=1 Tax=Dinoponera quadriceps TaxID=609295 RepID=A0A6P3YB02_DINQU